MRRALGAVRSWRRAVVAVFLRRRAARLSSGRPLAAPLPCRAMDASRDFFGKLRALSLTLEKEAKQLERALRKEDTDYEEESPIRALQDLHCEIKTLKEDVHGSLRKISSEKQAINDFMKASEILRQRNAADLGKIREMFQKYGYKPRVKDSTEEEEEVNSNLTVSVQNKSGEEKADDVPHLPASPEKPPVPKDLLHTPQLFEFGLSQYAFSRPWSAAKGQHTTNAHQEDSKNGTLLKTQSPCILGKIPKCTPKTDHYECATPKLEHFGISEHTMCMNEDFTMSLMRKAAQTSKKLVKKDDHEVNVPEMTPRKIMVTPGRKPKVTTDNEADWMPSPMVLVFCTPDVKTPSRTNSMLSRSPETNELPLPAHMQTPQFPDFETRGLKTEAKQVKEKEKIESATKNDATDKQHIEEGIPSTVSSDEYLKRLEDLSPPKMKSYDQLLSTPPPPEITRIPDDILQILSKYSHKVDSSKAKVMETKAGNITRYESDYTDYSNKENRGYSGFFKPNV
ncbi:PREDICTED: spindle and kinetochore-associated protein 3 [Calidris pugnax]|uniref:spindle and kinetochore-associated protein 3 n=1 Tax=Calidris pugnax TaxID=198806 RepID=UPI00071C433C|nr:PREDICTED: spindle and kinetochore-associated protein 3 [Calidris pugnax]